MSNVHSNRSPHHDDGGNVTPLSLFWLVLVLIGVLVAVLTFTETGLVSAAVASAVGVVGGLYALMRRRL